MAKPEGLVGCVMSEDRIDPRTIERFRKALDEIENHGDETKDCVSDSKISILHQHYQCLLQIKDHLNQNKTQKAGVLLEKQLELMASILDEWRDQ